MEAPKTPPSNGISPPPGNGIRLDAQLNVQKYLNECMDIPQSPKESSIVQASAVNTMRIQPGLRAQLPGGTMPHKRRPSNSTGDVGQEVCFSPLSVGSANSVGNDGCEALKLTIQAAVRAENKLMCDALTVQIRSLGADLRDTIFSSSHEVAHELGEHAQAHHHWRSHFDVAGKLHPMHPYSNNDVTQNGEIVVQSAEGTDQNSNGQSKREDYVLYRKHLARGAGEDLAAAVSSENSSGTIRRRKSEVRQTYLYDFTNVENIKSSVRDLMLSGKPAYFVQDYYFKTGIFQQIARHPYFEYLTLSIIVLNAFYIALDTDGNKAPTLLQAKTVYVVGDSCFFSYFTLEIIIRFMAFAKKRNAFVDPWFVFDSLICILYLFDPFMLAIIEALSSHGGLDLPTGVLRLLRLARLTRLLRMLRSLPELMIMIKSMVSALATVGYTLGLLLLITYVFGIAMRYMVPEGSAIEKTYFPSVPEAVQNLIIFGTFLDNLAEFMHNIQSDSAICLAFAWTYVAIASLMVLNMLIGILCEVIQQVAMGEREGAMIENIKDKFDRVLKKLDRDHDGLITWEEFQHVIVKPESVRALKGINVDPEDLVDAAEDFFFDENEVESPMNFGQFVSLVLDVRGGQQATVKDVLGMGKRVTQKFLSFKTRIDGLESKLDKILSHYQVKRSSSRLKLIA